MSGLAFGHYENDRRQTMLNIGFIIVFIVASSLGLIIIAMVIASLWRTGGDLPPDMLDGNVAGADIGAGLYLGTFKKGWKKRFNPSGLLLQGPGKFWVDDKGVNFLVDHAFQPVFIPFARIIGTGAEDVLLRKHRGVSALVVTWTLEDMAYRSAFVVDNADHQALAKQISDHEISAQPKPEEAGSILTSGH